MLSLPPRGERKEQLNQLESGEAALTLGFWPEDASKNLSV